MKKPTKIQWIIFGLILLLTLSFMGRRDSKSVETKVIPTPDYELIFRDEFMKSCVKGVTRAECTCMYNYVLSSEGFEGMVKIAKNYTETGETPDIYIEAAVQCSK